MRFSVAICLVAILLALGATTGALADVPDSINYQGILLDSGGDPVTTTVSVSFTIYDHPTAGVSQWSETQSVTPDAEGRFNVLLGTVVSLNETVFDEPDRYLEVQVAGDPPMTPRVPFVTVPYAYRVSTVDGSTGGVISGDVSIQSDLFVSGKATIGPGHTNTGTNCFVAGRENAVNSPYATVGGGYDNAASGDFAVVGGGSSNFAGIMQSTVGGGYSNTASNTGATVGGGTSNFAHGVAATIAGGNQNSAWASASVGGGGQNNASGMYGTIPGGYSNSAEGEYSFAAGRRAKAVDNGTFVWADHQDADFSSTDPGQFLIRAAGGVGIGTDAPGSQLHVNGTIRVGSGSQDLEVREVLTTDPEGWSSFLMYDGIALGSNSGLNRQMFIVTDAQFWGEALIFATSEDDGVSWQADFSIQQDGKIGMGTTTPGHPLEMASGAHVTSGGTWTNASDRKAKENFNDIDRQELLVKLAALPIKQWNYKADPDEVKHVGPVAQDFYALFGVGGDDKSISTVDPAGIALAAIQALYQQNQQQQKKNAELKERLEQLEALVQELLAERQ